MSPTPKPPRARVRRVLDARPLAKGPVQLKVRPFIESFDRGGGLPAFIMQGQLRGGQFQVVVTGRAAVSLAGSVSEDGHGPFALLHPQEHLLGSQHALRVDADAEDVDVCHAAISYFELTGDRVARQELEYAERWCSVYFNPLGLVDGSSWGGPRSIPPRGDPTGLN